MTDPYRSSGKPFEEIPPTPRELTAAEKRRADIEHYWALMATNSVGKTKEQLDALQKRADALLRRIARNVY